MPIAFARFVNFLKVDKSVLQITYACTLESNFTVPYPYSHIYCP